MTLIFIVGSASMVISFSIRVLIPGHFDVQPEWTMFPYRSFKWLWSHFMVKFITSRGRRAVSP